MARRPKSYSLSRRAEADLEPTYDFTLETWSKRQADKYYSELVREFKDLVYGKRKGRDAELRENVLKAPVGSHVVFYRVSERGVDIIRILHQAMDVSRHLKS